MENRAILPPQGEKEEKEKKDEEVLSRDSGSLFDYCRRATTTHSSMGVRRDSRGSVFTDSEDIRANTN